MYHLFAQNLTGKCYFCVVISLEGYYDNSKSE